MRRAFHMTFEKKKTMGFAGATINIQSRMLDLDLSQCAVSKRPSGRLIEREQSYRDLMRIYDEVSHGKGHTVFLAGEAGVGKTTLANHFLKSVSGKATVYVGACDPLFAPRPLGPLCDIAEQVDTDLAQLVKSKGDRSLIFSMFFRKLSEHTTPVVVVFEDIHWADEATLDLINFLGRRISRQRCMFVLTYRNDAVHNNHPVAKLFGHLSATHYSRIRIECLSQEAVAQLAIEHGVPCAKQLFELTAGNPFYVMEILRSGATKIPDSVKDSILTLFYAQREAKRDLWELLSILPSGIDLSLARRIAGDSADCMDECFDSGVIVLRGSHVFFKHELFRLAIEESILPVKKTLLHKKMLAVLLQPDAGASLSQLIHHARFADDREVIATLAPRAANEAATMGAHKEACLLYETAIEHTQKADEKLADLYERHAYECYLTNQTASGIASLEQALKIWQKQKVNLREADILRLLSRLSWFAGDYQKALALGLRSIELLENGFPTRERIQAYSNLSELYMLGYKNEESLLWANKAIDLARRMEDDEIVCHALNNVGTVLLRVAVTERDGEEKLISSLSLALQHKFHDHAARAYANLSSAFLFSRQYEKALSIFETGIKYCEERDLAAWGDHMSVYKSLLLLEKGQWTEAERFARMACHNNNPLIRIPALVVLARINTRRGNFVDATALISEGKRLSASSLDGHLPALLLIATLEFVWLSGSSLNEEDAQRAHELEFRFHSHSWLSSTLSYWMIKCGLIASNLDKTHFGPLKLEVSGDWTGAAVLWAEIGCPYEEALARARGNEDEQRKALEMLARLGADAVHEKFKKQLKQHGVRKLPRGPHASTRNNVALLTRRQIEILLLLRDGSQNKEIAEKLFISAKTVDHHISAILRKLNVHSRSRAVFEAQRLEILK